jgi:hypothetical protein
VGILWERFLKERRRILKRGIYTRVWLIVSSSHFLGRMRWGTLTHSFYDVDGLQRLKILNAGAAERRVRAKMAKC